ncbi:Putative nuclear polyadenylated RNA-binding protein Nab2/ZC3H14 [Septoria linicola]|uniref:Nuclear polyadenylated RNA-binding protein Nab2/ZC3H14 n=1 Tax=Septoria linicola TaxID=215465 RepID=A0A9Q9AZR3_9PEZI|nr:Putative nuclear polyadenylated RNA-binding protein Nab2/ZC3H14 [Septoria linicola]
MASTAVDAGSDHAQQLQSAIQPKLMENGWVTDENDMTLAEYVTMMIVNGKDAQAVQAELGNDLLAIGDDNPEVIGFTKWLYDQVQAITQPQQQQQQEQPQQQMDSNGAPSDQADSNAAAQDATMEDSAAAGDAPPTGPRSMRNVSGPQRGRGGRMLNQLNRNLDRSELPDSLRRIKGAAGGVGGAGRINSHSSRDTAPRGPKNNIARGVTRMMNGGRGGAQNGMGAMAGPPGVDPQQQMQWMQMMEMQANMFQQMLQAMPNGNGAPNGGRGGRGGRGSRGAVRGGRGGPQQAAAPTLHAVDGKMPDGALPSGPGAVGGDGMELDGDENGGGGKFSTLCRFDLTCSNPACGFAHHGPRTTLETVPNVDLSVSCSYGSKCTNKSCTGRHPSPATAKASAIPVPCKFYPNCQNANCPFTHPNSRPCKNGGDCTTPGCTFGHSKIVCRYNPCLNQTCPYKHEAGQKRGKFEDKVWTPNDKAERFADFKTEEGAEELILPGQSNGNGVKEEFGAVKQEPNVEMDADVVA